MQTPAPAKLELTGRPAAPGSALGPIVEIATPRPGKRAAGDPAHESAALLAAIGGAMAEIDALSTKIKGTGADMLEFQSAMLADDALHAPALADIAGGAPADAAWLGAVGAQIEEYQAAGDAYFRARASDLVDLRDRVLRRLNGVTRPTQLAVTGILAADDLTPSQFLEADWTEGSGIMLAAGSSASHAAVLARARGVPMVVGLGHLPISGHEMAMIDGASGKVVLSPGAGEQALYASYRAGAEARRQIERAASAKPATTRDGTPISVLVNIAGPADLAMIDPTTCDGIGLFRTELMFRDGKPLPDEETQYRAYRGCLEWAGERPVTIRTLDIGGDKPIRGLTVAGESNPFLGTRGIRLMLMRPDIFRVQLRALARAAVHGQLKVMLPMVTLPAELDETQRLLEDAIAGLAREGIASRRPHIGIMVEVPAAAIMAGSFASAAFFSIGSNDLTQYVMAASRDTPAVASLNEGAPDAVIRLIAETVAAAGALGIDVSLCGDMASDSRLLEPLLATGLRSFSVAPAALGRVKAALSRLAIGGSDGQA